MTSLLDDVAAILRHGGIGNAAGEAARIVKAAHELTPNGHAGTARTMAMRRASGAPLGLAIGIDIFMGIELIVAEGVLAPREETELLGNTALDVIHSCTTAPRVIDMCCGSGNLACAIALHAPHVRVWASDISDICVAATHRNIRHVGVSDRVSVTQSDLFAGLAGLCLEGSIDAIVCNPPYISTRKLETDLSKLLEYEPREAFDGGAYGINILQRVITDAHSFLRPGGLLLFEVGDGQGHQVIRMFERAKVYVDVMLVTNDAGNVRVISGTKRAESAAKANMG